LSVAFIDVLREPGANPEAEFCKSRTTFTAAIGGRAEPTAGARRRETARYFQELQSAGAKKNVHHDDAAASARPRRS
jgi:hypothetical protein